MKSRAYRQGFEAAMKLAEDTDNSAMREYIEQHRAQQFPYELLGNTGLGVLSGAGLERALGGRGLMGSLVGAGVGSGLTGLAHWYRGRPGEMDRRADSLTRGLDSIAKDVPEDERKAKIIEALQRARNEDTLIQSVPGAFAGSILGGSVHSSIGGPVGAGLGAAGAGLLSRAMSSEVPEGLAEAYMADRQAQG